MAGGVNQLADGSSQVTGGLGALSAGANQMAGGVNQLADGSSQVTGGLGTLSVGANQMAGGVNQLASGSGQVTTGLGALSTGSTQLIDGVNKLADGSGKVTDGLVKVNDGSGELAEKLGEGAEKTGEVKGTDKTYDMFASPVKVKTEKMAEVPNYGTGFTPYFYHSVYLLGHYYYQSYIHYVIQWAFQNQDLAGLLVSSAYYYQSVLFKR